MDEIAELNRKLDEHSKELLKCSMEYARLRSDAVTKRNVYDVAKAKALLKISVEHKDWKVDAQKAQMILECEPQMIEARISEAHEEAMKLRIKALGDSLTSVQTQAALLRTEQSLDRYRT